MLIVGTLVFRQDSLCGWRKISLDDDRAVARMDVLMDEQKNG